MIDYFKVKTNNIFNTFEYSDQIKRKNSIRIKELTIQSLKSHKTQINITIL